MRLTTILFLLLISFNQGLRATEKPTFGQIITNHLKNYPEQSTPEEKAVYLSRDIGKIAEEVLQRKVDLSSFKPSIDPYTGTPCLTSKVVWEGQSQGIPLTFFIYIWPAECVSRAINPCSTLYRSSVHKHSTSCAFAILQGTLVQENYSDVPGYSCNVARYESSDQLFQGDIEIDDLTNTSGPFIHRLMCRDQQGQTCMSLHAYGHPSEAEVHRSYQEFRHKYEYPYELKQNRLRRL